MGKKLVTKQDYLDAHWDMWDWIIDRILGGADFHSITSLKMEYMLEQKQYGNEYIHSNCFLCHYHQEIDITPTASIGCNRCCSNLKILTTIKGKYRNNCLMGLYSMLLYAEDRSEAAEIAFAIRDLEYKEIL